MNKRIVTLALAATVLSTGAFAADLPSRVAAPAPVMMTPPPVFTWTGFYIGVNAGAAFSNSNAPTFYASGLFPTPASNLNPAGRSGGTAFTGGIEAGYNWQTGPLVFGVETDFNYRGNGGNLNGTYATNPAGYGAAYPSYTLSGFNRSNWFGTVRGRVGYAVDRALFYVTGGLAYTGSQRGRVTVNGAGGFPNVVFNPVNGGSNTGWALGGGMEYALTSNMTAKIEYIHTQYGGGNTTYANGTGLSYIYNRRNHDDLVRAGVNFKFW